MQKFLKKSLISTVIMVCGIALYQVGQGVRADDNGVSGTHTQTPSYSFISTTAGTISYTGSCTSATTTAVVGTNTITFNVLANGTYADCKLLITDYSGVTAGRLNIPSFTVDLTTGNSGENNGVNGGDNQGNSGDNNGEKSDDEAISGSKYSSEFNDGYLYARHIGITTKNDIHEADMEGHLTRSNMAKMIANYAVNVLKKAPDTSLNCVFNDTIKVSAELQGYIQLACQLGLMGGGMINFNPNGEVTRAEFGTVLSRALYGDIYNTGGNMYYAHHLQALKDHNIITNANPWLKEIRGYVMLMLMRAQQ